VAQWPQVIYLKNDGEKERKRDNDQAGLERVRKALELLKRDDLRGNAAAGFVDAVAELKRSGAVLPSQSVAQWPQVIYLNNDGTKTKDDSEGLGGIADAVKLLKGDDGGGSATAGLEAEVYAARQNGEVQFRD
jgi:hypothetical protein